MTGVLAVYRKELLIYFRSPIAYVVVAVFLMGAGYFFTYNMLLTGSAAMDDTFHNLGILSLILLPLVSMRLFAGEYRGCTMELLMTLPLPPWAIVVGKFLGAVTILLLMIGGTLVDLVPLYLFGTPHTPTILAGYLGFLLLGMACLAVGQCCSALTQNQIVAALLTLVLLLSFWLIGHLQPFHLSPTWRGLCAYLSFALQYATFVQGLIRSDAVVFYLLVSAVALTLNVGFLQWRR